MLNSPRLSPQAVTQAAAAAELLSRRRARSNLLDFVQYTFQTYKVDPMHELLGEALTDVVQGKIDRLMVFAPPQSGKSQLTSVHLPAFWLGNRPNDPVIVTSYGSSLAEDKSKQARDIVKSSDFENLFGIRSDLVGPIEDVQPTKKIKKLSRSQMAVGDIVELRKDSQSSQLWKLGPPYRGYMLAAGVGGPVTGHGAMLGIIDDPFENWAAAQSETVRRHVWEWWRGTFRTRIWENGAVILIMTRWHEDDLAGRLLKDQPGRWKVLRLPALAETQAERDENNRFLGLPTGEADPMGREPGEPATPQRFSKQAMLEIKTDVGSAVFSAEYQGVPRPIEGSIIKRAWIKIVGAAPAKARRVRYWDKAGTEGGGDWTAGVLMSEKDGLYTVEDVIKGQWSSYERQKVIFQTAILDAYRFGKIRFYAANEKGEALLDEKGEMIELTNTDQLVMDLDLDNLDNFYYVIEDPGVEIWLEQEGGSGGKDSANADVKMLAGFRVRKDRPTGDKAVRGQPLSAQAEAGNFRVVLAPWNWDFINELTAFPNSAHDDQWDGATGAFNKLAGPRFVSGYGGRV